MGIKENMETTGRGGYRKGSGRPKLQPTKVLAYRVPISKANKIDKAIRKVIAIYLTSHTLYS